MQARHVVPPLALALAVGVTWYAARRCDEGPQPPWWMRPTIASDLLFDTVGTLDRIGLQPGQRVLEIGPGGGRLLLPAARRVLPDGSVTGLEVQPAIAGYLDRRAAKDGLTNVAVVQGDAAAAAFPPGSFDVVYLVAVLGEIGDREAALRQCHAVMKRGGTLSITEGWPDPHYQRYDAVRRVAESAGFRAGGVQKGRLRYTANFVR